MPGPTLEYHVAIQRPETHLVEVTLRAREPAWDEAGGLDLAMPAWTPGSYLIRDYARHLQDFEARVDGKAASWKRVDKQTWRIERPRRTGRGDVEVRYRLYANDVGVRSNHVDSTHGYLDGTNVFLYNRDMLAVPHAVTIAPPKGWHVDTALSAAGRKRNSFRAADYAELADATFEIGTHRRFEFEAAGKRHRVALYGKGNEDEAKIQRDLATIVREEVAMMGEAPYEEYLFIIHLLDKGGGGLEHRASNTSAVDRWTFEPAKKYEDFLALEAHEFFHVWNVKRIKPSVYVPYDYSKEVYTTLLWAMEGVTSYYDHLVLARAGLLSEERYREFLAETITKLRRQPGRFKLSLEDSSFLTWVKLYKADENWVNTGVSYYLKGELVAWILDLSIRDRTKGRANLDDVMRRLYAKYPAGSPGIPESPVNGWRETLEEVTGLDWGDFWTTYISGTKEVDFERFASLVGWDLKPQYAGETNDAVKKGEYVGPGAWLGINTEKKSDGIFVKSVLTESPAQAAGVAAGDELVALNGYRVKDEEFLKNRLRERSIGEEVTLTLFRRDALLHAKARLGEAPPDKWVLENDPRASAGAKKLRAEWLKAYVEPTARAAMKKRGPMRAKQARELVEEHGE